MKILYQQNPNNAEQLIGPNKMVNGQTSNLYSADEVINYIMREAQAGSFPKAINVPYNDKNARVFVFRNDEDVLRIVMSQKDPRVAILNSVTNTRTKVVTKKAQSIGKKTTKLILTGLAGVTLTAGIGLTFMGANDQTMTKYDNLYKENIEEAQKNGNIDHVNEMVYNQQDRATLIEQYNVDFNELSFEEQERLIEYYRTHSAEEVVTYVASLQPGLSK